MQAISGFELPSDLKLALSVLALVLLVTLVRAWRCRKWRRLLEAPAFETEKLRDRGRRRPAWTRDIPGGVNLDSERELFIVLYKHSRAKPRLRPPHALSAAVGMKRAAKSVEKLALPRLPEAPSLSDREKFATLVSAKECAIPGHAPTAPTDAIAQNLALNLYDVARGRKGLKLGLQHSLYDSMGPGGSFAGAKVGSAVGLSMAPFLAGASFIVTPACVLAGAWFGSVAGKKVGHRFKARQAIAAAQKVRRVAIRFKKWFLAQFPDFLDELDRDYLTAIEEAHGLARSRQGWLGRFFFPSFTTVFYRMSIRRLHQDRIVERLRFQRLRSEVKEIDPLRLVAMLEDLDPEAAKPHGDLASLRDAYLAALAHLRDVERAVGAALETTRPIDAKPSRKRSA